ncbi:hypothetical protein D187_008995 [Cystobacter fuscus DSM 2262]|uniref:Uncharacterized protein n=1 Tax=Cystobacter fuscus (strain ATCC 25194 / DSM 2262 / NBRC 100088 / M29) TaxID=1242864 RepID=S9Q256_CYSF2|nr:hypothetical protein D187_008995 [Cystobacter fuscus DSM 2262]
METLAAPSRDGGGTLDQGRNRRRRVCLLRGRTGKQRYDPRSGFVKASPPDLVHVTLVPPIPGGVRPNERFLGESLRGRAGLQQDGDLKPSGSLINSLFKGHVVG